MNGKYCIFSAQYFPHLGGIERYTYYIARELIKDGNSVVIVTNNTMNSKRHERINGIEVYRLPCHNFVNGRYPIMRFNKEFWIINKILNSKGFDAVIINARFYWHSIYAAKFARKRKIPVICIDHGTSHLSVHNRYLDFIGSVYEHLETALLKRYCKSFYGVSEACCEWLKHFSIRPKGILYNAVDLEEIEKIKSKRLKDFREEYNISRDDIIVTFTGRLLKEKGIYELIEAVKIYNKDNRRIHLMIAGDGDEWEEVSAKREDYIHPLGRLEFKEIIWLLSQSDIFCLPSFSEGFSTSALEAAACRCYIITTKRGGTKELVVGPEYGIVMEDNSVKSILEALKKSVDNNEKRDKAVELCYERLKEKYTWEKTARKIEQIFDKK